MVEKGADDLLDVFFALFVKWWGCVDVFCVLSFCTVGWVDMGANMVGVEGCGEVYVENV